MQFVHCWKCRLPVSPSGRRMWVDGMETTSREVMARTCMLVVALAGDKS